MISRKLTGLSSLETWDKSDTTYKTSCFHVLGKRKLARRFNLSYRYIDDLISFNNKRFKEFISDIYPKELTVSETTESTSVASYLDLLFMRDRSNNITTKLFDKRDAFGFHIVNFPFMSSNIPSAPAYGVYLCISARSLCPLLLELF